jgi:hypothetical protein
MGKQRKLRRADERAAMGRGETEGKREPPPVKESRPRRTDPYRRNVYVTDEEWEGVEPILREVGLTRSKFITVCFRWVIRNRDRSITGLQGGLFRELFGMGAENGKGEDKLSLGKEPKK